MPITPKEGRDSRLAREAGLAAGMRPELVEQLRLGPKDSQPKWTPWVSDEVLDAQPQPTAECHGL